MLRESTAHVIKKKRKEEDELRAEGLIPPKPKPNGKGRAVDGAHSAGTTGGSGDVVDEEEVRLIDEEFAHRIERIGLMVGGYVAEK